MPKSSSISTPALALGKLVSSFCRTPSTVKRGIIGSTANIRWIAGPALEDSSKRRRSVAARLAMAMMLRSASLAAVATPSRKNATRGSQSPSVWLEAWGVRHSEWMPATVRIGVLPVCSLGTSVNRDQPFRHRDQPFR